VYCASADLMERNLNRRVEVCFPIEDQALSARVLSELELYLNDGKQRWMQLESGQYQRVEQDGPAAQMELMRLLTSPPN
jgi:polyphosphate kinase